MWKGSRDFTYDNSNTLLKKDPTYTFEDSRFEPKMHAGQMEISGLVCDSLLSESDLNAIDQAIVSQKAMKSVERGGIPTNARIVADAPLLKEPLYGSIATGILEDFKKMTLSDIKKGYHLTSDRVGQFENNEQLVQPFKFKPRRKQYPVSKEAEIMVIRGSITKELAQMKIREMGERLHRRAVFK
jgi:hypothetical protein